MMYRTHCQRILDTVIRANFDEVWIPLLYNHILLFIVYWKTKTAQQNSLYHTVQVQSFLLHFWQGMPPHMLPVLGSPTVVNIVGVCDSILYKAISGVLMPTVLQALPDRWGMMLFLSNPPRYCLSVVDFHHFFKNCNVYLLHKGK